MIKRFLSRLVLYFLVSVPLIALEVAVITADQNSENFKIVAEALKKDKYKIRVFDLTQLDEFPYYEVFDYLKTAVIRIVERDNPASHMDYAEAELWEDFLVSNGSFVLIADHLGPQEVYDSVFPRYVGFRNEKRDLSSGRAKGLQKDLITDGMQMQINFDRQSDIIVPLKNSGIDRVLRHSDGNLIGMKQQSCAFKMSYYSFLPSWIEERKDAIKLVRKTMEWNLGFALSTGMKAPDFPILHTNGKQEGLYNQLNALAPNIVVIEFMATWCSYCKKQLPRMIALNEEMKDKGVDLLFVDYKETPEKIKEYLAANPGITWPIVITENGLGAKRYGVRNLPAIFILDENRKVRYIHKGTVSKDVLKGEINQLLREKAFNSLHEIDSK